MIRKAFPKQGVRYHYHGPTEAAKQEYERFKGCLLQLTDPDSMLGDLTDRWVIFQSGWVFGLSSYADERTAIEFAAQIFRDDKDASFIIADVNPYAHADSEISLLASILGDIESDSIRRQSNESGN